MHAPAPPRLTLYTHAQLRRVLAPRSVAVLGATPRPGSFGERTVTFLAGFGGGVYPVNAKYAGADVAGQRCHASLADLPEVPDCAFIVAGRESVEALAQDCAQAGVGGAVIFAAGYAETGLPERVLEQERLRQLAQATGLRIVGPNCVGLYNYTSGLCGSFSHLDLPRPQAWGAVGLVSQSGALGVSASQAVQHGASLSHLLTVGNSCDVDVADLVAYLADDPACQAIACIFEGMAHPRRLLAAADLAWQRGKPLVVLKIATGTQGALAAQSHTGALAGSHVAYRAAFERAGVIVVDDHEALVETASFFAKAGLPRSRGVAVVATSGGAAIMAADKGERHGVPLPQPAAATTAVLRQHVPEFGSVANPCDVTAQVIANPGSLRAVGHALLGDAAFGTLVYPAVHAGPSSAERMPVFDELGRAHGKPVCIVWLPGWQEGPGLREAMALPHTPVFHSTDRCFAALAAWHRYGERRRAAPPRAGRLSEVGAAAAAAVLIDRAPHAILTEREAKAVLAIYGVPVIAETLATSAEAAVRAAADQGYPVVLKVESPDLLHKTEAGVIRLNLEGPDDVREAFAAVMANAAKVSPAPRVQGVIVQPMARPGTEIMVGARIDPQFGALVVIGLGGVMVELLNDTVAELAPVTHGEALAMLARLKAQAALDGFRGSAPVDRDRLADTIVRLSEFAADQAGRIAELDVNPLVCAGPQTVAVDALIVRRDGATGAGGWLADGQPAVPAL